MSWRTSALAGAMWLGLSGCAEGPLYYTGHLAPWSRDHWAKEELHGPTYHAKRKQLTATRDRVASMTPADAESTAQELIAWYGREENDVVRMDILVTVAALPGASAASFVDRAKTDSDPLRRELCCQLTGQRIRAGLESRDGPETLMTLAAQDRDNQVRLAALRELAAVPGDGVTEVLSVALDDDDPAIQLRAIRSLAKRTGQDFGDDTSRWKDYLAGRPVEETRTSWLDPRSYFR